jgi:peptidoglycan/LPS O-acetylase OafA/YrhL
LIPNDEGICVAEAERHSTRIVSLDALRGLASLAVAIPHYFIARELHPALFQSLSVVSVEIFFVLSGFVLAPQIMLCIQSKSKKDLLVFYRRRWMRTLPPYFVAVSLIALLTANLFTTELWKYIFFVQNILWIDAARDFFPVAWSLSIEEWFYLLFPAFLLVLNKRGYDPLRATLIFIAIFGAAKIIGLAILSDWNEVARRLVVFRLDAVGFGFLLWILVSRRPNAMARQSLPLHAMLVAISATALAVTMFYVVYDNSTIFRLLFFYVAPSFGASLIMMFCAANDFFSEFRLVEQLSNFFGAISYDIYLFHLPIILLVDRIGAGPYLTFAIYILAVVAFSSLMRLAVENRILAARPNYTRVSGSAFHGPQISREEALSRGGR